MFRPELVILKDGTRAARGELLRPVDSDDCVYTFRQMGGSEIAKKLC